MLIFAIASIYGLIAILVASVRLRRHARAVADRQATVSSRCRRCGFDSAWGGARCARCGAAPVGLLRALRGERRAMLRMLASSLVWPLIPFQTLAAWVARGVQNLPRFEATVEPLSARPVRSPEQVQEPHADALELVCPEAEKRILGTMILWNEAIPKVASVLAPEAMVYRPNRVIYRAILALWNDGRVCDSVALVDELDRRGEISEACGTGYLAELVDAPRSKAFEKDLESILRQSEIRKRPHHQDTPTSQSKRLGEILVDTVEAMPNPEASILGIPTGLLGLDDLLSGLQRSRLYVVAGHPSIGKTSLATRIVEHVALESEKPVLYFTLGESAAQLARQMLSAYTRISSHKVRTGRMSEEDFQNLLMGAGSLHEAPVFFDESLFFSMAEISARAREERSKRGIALVVVDSFQGLQDANARALKALAEELEIPVMVLAGLDGRSQGPWRPKISDVRPLELAREADAVLLLHREEYYDPDTPKRRIAEVEIARNRTGPTGLVELAFFRECARFENR